VVTGAEADTAFVENLLDPLSEEQGRCFDAVVAAQQRMADKYNIKLE